MRFLLVVLFGTVICPGQIVIAPEKVAGAEKQFEHRPDEVSLVCTAAAVKPAIDFSFRFHSGYAATIPMKQYSGGGHGFIVLTKITPDDAPHQPVYLASTIHLPDVPKSSDEL